VDNLLLLSMLVATIAIPALTARLRDGRRALKWTFLALAAFTLAYAFLVRGWYAAHQIPEPFAP
jgi:formate hydrogenlyase subunit 3/multisubunit Na+/H+ antiporter MnhD subunit